MFVCVKGCNQLVLFLSDYPNFYWGNKLAFIWVMDMYVIKYRQPISSSQALPWKGQYSG